MEVEGQIVSSSQFRNSALGRLILILLTILFFDRHRLLERMNTYFPETRNQFEAVLDWMNQWACARSYGLGSKLPWDQQFLVESLSDSTIYTSYYTIADQLQGKSYSMTSFSM